MKAKILMAILMGAVLLIGANPTLAKTQDKDQAVLQADVTVGKSGAFFLTQLRDAVHARGFAMRATPIETHRIYKKKKHRKGAPAEAPDPGPYTPMLVEIWRGDLKVVADNTKNEEAFHFALYNWILTPRYVMDKSLVTYRNEHGTPAEEFLQVLNATTGDVPAATIAVVQPETQYPEQAGDAPAPLRELQVTVNARHYAEFVSALHAFAAEHKYAVYSDTNNPGVHDRYYSDELLVTVTSNRAGDLDFAFYEGDAGDTTTAFNQFMTGLRLLLDNIPYSIIHEQKSYDWPTPEKE